MDRDSSPSPGTHNSQHSDMDIDRPPSMHNSQRYLNLVCNGSSWKTKRTGEGVEVHYGEYPYGRNSEESSGSSQSIESVMLKEELNRVQDMRGITWQNDHGEEGFKKTENSERKNSGTFQEFKNHLYGLVKGNASVKKENSVVQKGGEDENEERTMIIDHGEEGVPEMPEVFRNRILELFGENSIVTEAFIMQKEVERTDCIELANWLLIRDGTLLEQFLGEDEIKVLPRYVKIFEPGLDLCELRLSSWGSKIYVLEGQWEEVRARNSIAPGMIVQLFGVRLGGEFWVKALKNLLFVLVDVTPADLKAKLITEAAAEAENGDGESSEASSSPHLSSGSS